MASCISIYLYQNLSYVLGVTKINMKLVFWLFNRTVPGTETRTIWTGSRTRMGLTTTRWWWNWSPSTTPFSFPWMTSQRKTAGLSLSLDHTGSTAVSGFSVLGFRALPWFKALNAGNQIWFYTIELPGFSALPGFKAPFEGDGQSTLNPGTTV